jgi:hypothetical protein
MAENDIGSLVVMERGELVGMLTFREVIQSVVRNGGSVGPPSCAASWTTTRSPARRDRDRRGAAHDAGPPRALHAGDEPTHT